MQTAYYYSAWTLVICARDLGEIPTSSPNRYAKYEWFRLKSAIFDDIFAILQKQCSIGHQYYGRLIGTRICAILNYAISSDLE